MSPKARNFTLWGLSGFAALGFAFAGISKLAGSPMMVEEFSRIGFGQGFRYFTGLVEVLGSGMILWPRTRFLGAIGLIGVCAGALAAQLGPLKGDVVHVFAFAAAPVAVAWLSRPRAG